MTVLQLAQRHRLFNGHRRISWSGGRKKSLLNGRVRTAPTSLPHGLTVDTILCIVWLHYDEGNHNSGSRMSHRWTWCRRKVRRSTLPRCFHTEWKKRQSSCLRQWKLGTLNCRQTSLGLNGIHQTSSDLGLRSLCWRTFEWSEFWSENHFLPAEIFIIYPGFRNKKEKPWPILTATTCKIVSNSPRKWDLFSSSGILIGGTHWNATCLHYTGPPRACLSRF